jgi:hypothetical protein
LKRFAFAMLGLGVLAMTADAGPFRRKTIAAPAAAKPNASTTNAQGAALLIVQGALMVGLHTLLTLIVLRAVVRGGGTRTIGRGLLLPIAIHTPVAVVRTLFPMATTPVLLGALAVAALAYRRGKSAMTETPPAL